MRNLGRAEAELESKGKQMKVLKKELKERQMEAGKKKGRQRRDIGKLRGRRRKPLSYSASVVGM